MPDRWFETKRIGDRITLLKELNAARLNRCSMQHVLRHDSDLPVNAGMEIGGWEAAKAEVVDKPLTVVATHTISTMPGPSRV